MRESNEEKKLEIAQMMARNFASLGFNNTIKMFSISLQANNETKILNCDRGHVLLNDLK